MARIFLIGPMGSGKSTVGKSLARKLQYQFFDCDREIEARCGVDIPTIFEFEGETGFRKREKKALSELTEIDDAVIATGGGVILNRANRKILRERGHVILLAVDIEEQLRRVSLNKNRPLLQVGDVESKLRTLMDERHSLYESTAHHVVSTNSSRMQNVVTKIIRHLQRNEIVVLPAAEPPKKRAAKSRAAGNTAKTGKTASPASSAKKTTGSGGNTRSGTQSSGSRKPSDRQASGKKTGETRGKGRSRRGTTTAGKTTKTPPSSTTSRQKH